MSPRTCDLRFEELLAQAGFEPEEVPPEVGVRLMLAFYHDERVDGCLLDIDADALLFQWSCHDWGEGEEFQMNITRQLIDDDGEDEDILHLGLTFRFEASAELRAVAPGNRWCFSPSELEEFRSFVQESSALSAIGLQRLSETRLRLELAG